MATPSSTATDAVKQKKSNLIIRLFKGNVPLPVTFWFFGVLISFIWFVLAPIVVLMALNLFHASSNTTQSILAILMTCLLLGALYLVIISVPIWKSATQYNKSTFWKVLAKIFAVLGGLYGVLLFIAIPITHALVSGLGGEKNAVWTAQGSIAHDVATLNASLPMMIDEETELTRVAQQDNTITYTHKIVHYSFQEVNVKEFQDGMLKVIAEKACETPSTRALLQQGQSLSFAYVSKDNKPIANIVVTERDCKQ